MSKNFLQLARRLVLLITALFSWTQASADILYGSTYSSSLSRSQLYSIRTETGQATLIGGNNVAFLPGLAFSPQGSLFASGLDLWLVDPTTGNPTVIGALPELTVSIAFSPQGELWGVGNGTETLWQIDSSTGQSLGAGFLSGLKSGGIRSIAFDNEGSLFGIGQGVLYNIDTSTFIANAIADFTPCCFVSGLAFGSGGRLFTSQGNSLFGTSTLSSVDRENMILSAIGPATTMPPAIFMNSLAAPISAVPEVDTYALMSLGLLLIIVFRGRMQKEDSLTT